MTAQDDPLWRHFAPIWAAIRDVDKRVLLTGGYGLFLKQRWLLEQASRNAVRHVIPFDRWRDYAPRVTQDVDLLASMELIVSAKEQAIIDAALTEQAWLPSEGHARWQFVRTDADTGHQLKLEFHAQHQEPLPEGLTYVPPRIKPRPPLHHGIHGHENPEAIACQVNPFAFQLDGLEIAVPNPVTMATMKLTAMRDQHAKSRDAGLSARAREFHDRQARKHAQDVIRIVAMTTLEESDRIGAVLDTARPTRAWQIAAEIVKGYFLAEDGYGATVVSGFWNSDDQRLVTDLLTRWFATAAM